MRGPLFALGCGLRRARRRNALLQHRDVGAVARERKRHSRSSGEPEHVTIGMIHGDVLEQLRRPAIPLRAGAILSADRQIGDRSSRGRPRIDAPVAGLNRVVAGGPEIGLAAGAEVAHLRALRCGPGDNGPAADKLARLRLADQLRVGASGGECQQHGRQTNAGRNGHADPHTTIVTGFSISALKAPRSSAPSAPSTARWSVESVTDIIHAGSILPSLTIARSSPAPTARMVACGGLMTAAKSLMPYMPRLDTALEPP